MINSPDKDLDKGLLLEVVTALVEIGEFWGYLHPRDFYAIKEQLDGLAISSMGVYLPEEFDAYCYFKARHTKKTQLKHLRDILEL